MINKIASFRQTSLSFVWVGLTRRHEPIALMLMDDHGNLVEIDIPTADHHFKPFQ